MSNGKMVKKSNEDKRAAVFEDDSLIDNAPTVALDPADDALSDMTSEASVDKLLDDGFAIEQFVSFKEGQCIRGVYLGPGGTIQVNDPQNPAEKRPLDTIRIRHPKRNSVVLTIGATAQLKSRIGGLPSGTEIQIKHLGKIEVGNGRRCNDYLVMTKQPKILVGVANG